MQRNYNYSLRLTIRTTTISKQLGAMIQVFGLVAFFSVPYPNWFKEVGQKLLSVSNVLPSLPTLCIALFRKLPGYLNGLFMMSLVSVITILLLYLSIRVNYKYRRPIQQLAGFILVQSVLLVSNASLNTRKSMGVIIEATYFQDNKFNW